MQVQSRRRGKSMDERGLVITLLALLLTAILGIVALVIDGSRRNIVVEHLQNAADAAAMAGVRKLNGKPNGMRLAKRAAVGVLIEARISGLSAELDDSFELTLGDPDPYENQDPGNRYRALEGEAGNLHVKIERGYYRDLGSPDGELNFQFQSLEGINELFGVESHVLANAVRVTLNIEGVETTFARVFGTQDFGSLVRTSIALYDSELQPCVAPIAIPLCQLMLNTGTAGGLHTTSFNPGMQCQREFTATEAYAEVSDREEGLNRASWYPLPPYVYMDGSPTFCQPGGGYPPGNYLNCKAIPAKAVLGIPTSDPSEAALPAAPSEVAELLKGDGGCIKAGIGSRFRSMNAAVNTSGLPIDAPNGFLQEEPGSVLEQRLLDLINNSPDSQPFNDVFRPGGIEQPNYPHLRRIYTALNDPDPFRELRISWPIVQQPGTAEMYLAPKGAVPDDPYQWKNPAATTPGTGAKVKPINVMIIANQLAEKPYCDFENLFAMQQQNAFAPTNDTEPIVVGFAKAYLIDFHIRRHANNELIPGDTNPWKLVLTDAIRSYLESLFDHIHDHQSYVGDYRTWAGCMACVECQNKPCDPPGPPNEPGPTCFPWGCTLNCPQCQSEPHQPSHPGPPPAVPSFVTECFEPLPIASFGSGAQYLDDEDYDEYLSESNGLLGQIATMLSAGGMSSLPGKECVPRKLNDCFPGTNPACWVVEDHKPQYLLGGLRFRLDCASAKPVSSAAELSAASPILIE